MLIMDMLQHKLHIISDSHEHNTSIKMSSLKVQYRFVEELPRSNSMSTFSCSNLYLFIELWLTSWHCYYGEHIGRILDGIHTKIWCSLLQPLSEIEEDYYHVRYTNSTIVRQQLSLIMLTYQHDCHNQCHSIHQ